MYSIKRVFSVVSFFPYQERRGHSLTNRNKNRWFKFNDTTVEEFEMTDEKMMNECFGGTYKVNNHLTPDNSRKRFVSRQNLDVFTYVYVLA